MLNELILKFINLVGNLDEQFVFYLVALCVYWICFYGD